MRVRWCGDVGICGCEGVIQAGSSTSGSLLMKKGCVLSSCGTREETRGLWLPPSSRRQLGRGKGEKEGEGEGGEGGAERHTIEWKFFAVYHITLILWIYEKYHPAKRSHNSIQCTAVSGTAWQLTKAPPTSRWTGS